MAELSPIKFTTADIPKQCLQCPVFEERIKASVIYAKWEANDNPHSLLEGSELSVSEIGLPKTGMRIKGWRGKLNKLIDIHNEYVTASPRIAKFDEAKARDQAISDRVSDMSFCQSGPVDEVPVGCGLEVTPAEQLKEHQTARSN